MKTLLLVSAGLLASSLLVSAHENWPQMPPDEVARQEGWKKHQQEVIARTRPVIAEWVKQGKPYVPWAAQPSDLPQAKVPAFPGAEGGGEYSFGGRGGKVFVVTNLADDGPGSFREACESAGPRVIVFNVAGIIQLKAPVWIEAPYLTIAGQTAPGDGVCIAGESVMDDTHDVVIRYMRFRRGNTNIFDRQSALAGSPIGNIILDHCSASWGNDQTFDTYRHMYQPTNGGPALKLPCVNDTIQWCIVSEALNIWNHGFGGDWGGMNTAFHHNLFACNTGRNPSIAFTHDFNFVNNVLFNWRHRSLDGGDRNSMYNIISNYYKPGPATLSNSVRFRILEPAASWSKADPVSRWGKAYVQGNIVDGYPKITADNWAGGVQFNKAPDVNADGEIAKGTVTDTNSTSEIIKAVRVDKPFPMPHVTMQTAEEAYKSVLAKSGATLPKRDSVDERAVRETETGITWGMGEHILPAPMKGLAKNNIGLAGNGIITEISQVGGYPKYEGKPVADLGADGIPASWKSKYGLDANDPMLAQKDLQGDGYTVLDKYLDGLDPTKKIDWNDPASNLNTLQ